MTLKDIIWGAVVVVVATAITLTILGLISGNGKNVNFGAAGNLLAENYIPYVLYNQGYNSAKPIQTTSTLSISGLASLLGGFTAGSTGTQVNGINYGTCTVLAYATTIAASTTGTVDCQGGQSGAFSALTGVSSGDTVNTFATTTIGSTTFGSVIIAGSHASTTAGSIELIIRNNTGATFTWNNTASTSMRYIDLH
jgi:hypothetical protein